VAAGEELDDVVVRADGGVQAEFDVELFGAQAAGAEGVLFVDELDGDDGARRVPRDGFADAASCLVSSFLPDLWI
jgi:hypothetical protein